MVVVNYWGHVLGINIETEMRRRAFDHLQKLSFSYFDKQKTGHLVARVTKDLEEVGESSPPRTGRFVHRCHDIPGRAGHDAGRQRAPRADHRPRRVPPMAFVTSRYGGRMTQTWRAIFSPGGRLQRAHRGKTSAASAWSRPSPTRTTSDGSLPGTTPTTGLRSSMLTG